MTAPKLVWIREHEPDVWARIAHVLLPKDYVRLQLTGEHAIDKADGAGTLLFDLAARDWSPEILDALRIPPAWLPPTNEGPAVTGAVTAAAAAATGLRAGTPVVAGGGDQSANAVGVGVIAPGTVALSLGTSGVVFAATTAPLHDERGRVHAFCHALPERWHLMSVMLSAAGSLRWFRDTFAPGEPFDQLVATAAAVPPGSEGLWFLPYLSGERSPHPDPQARGAFVGLTLAHDRRHLLRAVLEGVAFGLRDGLDLMVAAGMPAPTPGARLGRRHRQPAVAPDPRRRPGGRDRDGRHDRGRRVRRRPPRHASGGLVPVHRRRRAALVRATPVTSPGPDVPAYRDAHAAFRELYPALVPFFHRA